MSIPLTSTAKLPILSTAGLPLIPTPVPTPDPPVWTVQPSFGQSTYNLGDAVTISPGSASGTITVEYFKLGATDKSGELSGFTWPGEETEDETPGTLTCKLRATSAAGFTLSDEITADLEDITSGEGTAIAFGALTLAGAGGVPRPSGSTSISSAGGTNLVMSGTSVVAGTGGGVSAGTVTFNNGAQWTIAAAANEYSVRTVSEMEAVNALGTAALGGKTMRLRPGTYNVAGTNWLDNRSFATRFTIASHDTPAFPGIGSPSHSRVKVITRINGIHDSYAGMARITFDGICIEGQHDRNDTITASNRHVMFMGNGSVTDIIYQNCWLKGDDEKIGVGTNLSGCVGQFGTSIPSIQGTIGLAIRDSRVSNLYRAFFLNRHGRKEVSRCQIDHCSLDSGIIGWSGETLIQDCFIFGPSGDRSHIQWSRTSGGSVLWAKASRDASITGVSDSLTGVFCGRMDNGTPGERGVLWAMQSLNGTAYAALEKTAANRVYFWAADSGGTKRVELTSGITLRDDYFYNVLVSVNNGSGQTSRMLVWESAPKQGALPVEDYSTDTGTGQTLNWDAGGMSIGALNVGTDGDVNYRGSAGRWLFHSGVTVDVTDPAVQARFFDVSVASGPTVEDYTLFTPAIDIKASLAEWRTSADSGNPVPNGGSGQSVVLRTGRATVEAGHPDGFQGITNPGSGGYDAGPPITLVRNIYCGHELDGTVSANGGQVFFLEDIRDACYVNVTMRNNLAVNAGPNSFFTANPDNARFEFNSIVAHPAFQADYGHLQRIRLTAHSHPTAWHLSDETRARFNAYVRSNLAQGYAIEIDLTSPDTHPTLFDNTQMPEFHDDGALGVYFKGSNGDGTGFDWTTVTSLDRLKAMFATNPSLNPPGVVKRGWDAYWNEPSPWDGTCSDATIASISGPGESAFVTPGSVSTGGIAVHAGGFLECRLYESGGTAISDWTTRPLHLSSGQKFKVRRTSGTGTTLIYFGNQTANWTVT